MIRWHIQGQPGETEATQVGPRHTESRKIDLCDTCGGAGCLNSILKSTCPKCEGSGRLITTITTIVNPYHGK